MRLRLKNIGKVRSADVEINGITVIAGENNTGKSTVGKALFAVFNSLYQSEKKITNERLSSINNQLHLLFRNATGSYYYDLDDTDFVMSIYSRASKHLSSESLINIISETILHYDEKLSSILSKDEVSTVSERIATSLKIDDIDIFRTVLQRRLDAEFNEQISNLYNSDDVSSIDLFIRNEHVCVLIENNNVFGAIQRLNLGTEAIYIDDPFVLDEIPGRIWRNHRRYADHRTHLKEKLYQSQGESNVVEEIIANNKLNYIYSKLSSVCEGDVVRDKSPTLTYSVAGSEKALDVRNLSTGLKTFAILKMLLVNGKIDLNGTIILDEPEIHLHPEWQVLFAELIVLLHCEFGLHILLNTHSPYFLNAIEVYAAKYGIGNQCKYYLAENQKGVSVIEDVTDNIEAIYQKLARPLQNLENERCQYD